MNRIKQLRNELNISQSELAEKFSLTQQAISAYENSTRDLDSGMLNKLADFFDVSVDYLLGRTDIRNVEHESGYLTREEAEKYSHEFIQILIDLDEIKEGQELTDEERKYYFDIFKESLRLAQKYKKNK